MYDRPTAEELIEAARMHLESAIIPVVRQDRRLYFQTLVAINVMRIVERELSLGPDHARTEWERLNDLEGTQTPIPDRLAEIKAALKARNTDLSAAIRAGEYDSESKRRALFDHLAASVVEQLQVANPRLLQKMAEEDANPDLDAWHNHAPF